MYIALISWLFERSTFPTSTWSMPAGISPILYSPNPILIILLKRSRPKISSPITSTVWSKTSITIFQTWEYSSASASFPLTLNFSIVFSIFSGTPRAHRKSYRPVQKSAAVFLPLTFFLNLIRGAETRTLKSLISLSMSLWASRVFSSGMSSGLMRQFSSRVHWLPRIPQART